MRARSARTRVTARLVTVAALTMLGGSWIAPDACATPTPARTTVVMRLVPRGPVSVDSLIDLYATVTPASAAGTVVFSVNGPTGTTVRSSLSGGIAHVGPAGIAQPGTWVIQASFQPADPSAFLPSTSASQRLQVSTHANLTILTPDAVPLIPGSGVRAGQRLTAMLATFPPGARVALVWDGRQLGRRITTDTRGGALAAFVVPSRQKPGLHTVTARVGEIGASVRLLIGNPTSTLQTSIRPPQRGHGGGKHGGEGGIPRSGGSHSTDTLPRTGVDVAPMAAGALALIVLGTVLVRVAARQPRQRVVTVPGRHLAVR